MKKQCTKAIIAAAILALSVLPMNVLAAVPSQNVDYEILSTDISPRWSETSSVAIYVTPDGTSIYATTMIDGMTGKENISGTLYLEKYSGEKWVKVKSWSFSGTGWIAIEKKYAGQAGTEYRARVVAKVGSETVAEISSSCEL